MHPFWVARGLHRSQPHAPGDEDAQGSGDARPRRRTSTGSPSGERTGQREALRCARGTRPMDCVIPWTTTIWRRALRLRPTVNTAPSRPAASACEMKTMADVVHRTRGRTRPAARCSLGAATPTARGAGSWAPLLERSDGCPRRRRRRTGPRHPQHLLCLGGVVAGIPAHVPANGGAGQPPFTATQAAQPIHEDGNRYQHARRKTLGAPDAGRSRRTVRDRSAIVRPLWGEQEAAGGLL